MIAALVPRFGHYVLLLFAALLHFVAAVELDFTITIPPGRLQCYFQPVTNESQHWLEFDYQVIDGGDLDINVLVSNPNGQVLIQDMKKMDATHKIDVSTVKGDYQLCFDNSFSYQASKMIFFELFLTDKDGAVEQLDFQQMASNVAEIAHALTSSVKDTVQRIKTNMNRAEQLQSLLRAFEARDRAIMEANFDRVNFWSIVNALCLMGVAVVQVYTIRSLFEDKSRLAKVFKTRT